MCKLRFGAKFNNLKWVPKILCLMTFNTISKDRVIWYLISGCCRHKITNPFIFIWIKSHNRRSVTFGDNGK